MTTKVTTAAVILAVTQANTGKKYTLRQFRSIFGVSPTVAAMCWEYMLNDSRTLLQEVQIKDLLKALHFLKCYSTETQLASLFCITEKPFVRGTSRPFLF